METEAYKLLMETVVYHPFFFFLKKNFSRVVGGSLSYLRKFLRGGGGGHQFPAKMENPGRWGGPE